MPNDNTVQSADALDLVISRLLRAPPTTLSVDAHTTVSALWQVPEAARACYVFAHGAGAGMRHAFMANMAERLAGLGVATLRYQFPFMERGSKRVDAPALAHATVRAAVKAAGEHLPQLPLFAGGKSFGGRMTSQAQAVSALDGVRGLACVGFPLHPAGKPGIERAEHLVQVDVPMLFLQGTRDALADLDLLEGVLAPLTSRATLHRIDDADHAFHVRVRSLRNDDQVADELAQTLAAWFTAVQAQATQP